MDHRILGAVCFALAAVVFWVGFEIVMDELGGNWAWGICIVLAALLCGTAAGERMSYDAQTTRRNARGIIAGLLVTIAIYLLGTLFFSLWVVLGPIPANVGTGLEGLLSVLGTSLFLGVFLLPFALVLGALTGWLFYRIVTVWSAEDD